MKPAYLILTALLYSAFGHSQVETNKSLEMISSINNLRRVGNLGQDQQPDDLLRADRLQINAGLYAVAAGSSNALVLSLQPTLGELSEGQVVFVKISGENTGAVSVQVDGHGPFALQKSGAPLSAGVLQPGRIVKMAFVGGVFELL